MKKNKDHGQKAKSINKLGYNDIEMRINEDLNSSYELQMLHVI